MITLPLTFLLITDWLAFCRADSPRNTFVKLSGDVELDTSTELMCCVLPVPLHSMFILLQGL